ncbi:MULTISPECIES: hypothetical protein [Kitasatospora]|uniref:Integral membrane protein n=1 Tax=Kitasatospora cystarginea TaxID=58350 RepID=A0ABP5RV57_9ACTN
MASDAPLRHGSSSTDLVSEQSALGGPPSITVTLLAAGVAFPAAMLLVTIPLAFLIGDFLPALLITLGLIAVGCLIFRAVLEWDLRRQVTRVEFAPAGTPTSLRLVRVCGADQHLPITDLLMIEVTQVTVEPYFGDPLPRRVHLQTEFLLRTGREKRIPNRSGPDPQPLVDALTELLAPLDVPVELKTERTVRKRQRDSYHGKWGP